METTFETGQIGIVSLLFLLALAVGLGFAVKGLPKRHSTLLSGVSVMGAILAANQTGFAQVSKWLALAAIVLATITLVGGYVASARMHSAHPIPRNKPKSTGT